MATAASAPSWKNIIHTENLGPCTTITGFLRGHAFVNALQDVNVVVMPSMWEETAGLAAIEQMMRGRLVIAADIGGLAGSTWRHRAKIRAGKHRVPRRLLAQRD